MNKQEAIEKIKSISYDTGVCSKLMEVSLDKVIEIVEQIDEPEKPVLPKDVAEWFEEYDWREDTTGNQTLIDVLDNLNYDNEHGYYKEIKYWVERNGDTFARAWLDGYEIEQEQLYTVEIPNPNRKGNNRFYLHKDPNTGVIILSKGNFNIDKNKNLWLTESEIKQDFEWAWQWAKPVEE